MKQDVWEKKVSEQLRQRRINPRPELWKKLEEELGGQVISESRKSPLILYWRYAAVVAVALVVASQIWKREEQESSALPEVVVEQPEQEVPEKISERMNYIAKEITETESISGDKENSISNSQPQVRFKEIQEEELVIVDVESGSQNPSALDLAIEEKTQGLLAEVLAIQDTGKRVTDSEVDSLLRRAQNEILMDRQLIASQSSKTDAMALLAEAEFELYNDQNFRDRLFDSLKDSFLRVSTAVAQRNK